MGCYADYETTNVVCVMPTGSGKSTFFEAINCWIVAVSPGSTLYASQTNNDAEFWLETRLLKSLKRCQPLDQLWPANLRNAVRKDAIVWPHMFMQVGGANISNFQERSITYGQGDEAWAWKRGMVREWLARHGGQRFASRAALQAALKSRQVEAGVVVRAPWIGADGRPRARRRPGR